MTDAITRSHTYREMTREMRPQDAARWTFELLECGGEYPTTMPQAIRATDATGRSCIYVPITVDHDVVDSLGFELRREPEVQKPGLRLVPKENGAA